jgi:quercetin dioxygenase-like cupin family protein
MNPPTPSGGIIQLPDGGYVVRAFGDEIRFHLDGKQTGNAFTTFTDVTPPGGGPPPHYHTGEDETFLVLEGRASFFCDGQWQEVPVGTVVHMPRGVVHTFKNVGDTPLRQLITTRPSGFETFMTRCGEEFKKPEGPDMARIVSIAAEHGICFLKP